MTSPAPSSTVAEINLGALCANYRFLAHQLASGRSTAVVKANAYGLGAVPVAQALRHAGCSEFFVATISEALLLRQAMPDVMIGVFYGVATAEDAALCVEHRLWPSLNSLHQVALWREAAHRHAIRLPACLHVDSGMTRLGMSYTDMQQLATRPDLLEGLDVRLIMSHLACAGEPQHPLNAEQLQRFNAAHALFPRAGRSLANSSGIFLGADYHGELVRPGAALYGINPTPDHPNPMQTVVTVKAPVLQLRTLDKAEYVGYNATYHAPAGARLATLGAGYADGLLRSMSGKAQAYAGGERVPLAGIVSMDLIVIDISQLPADAVGEGDMVELIGPNLPLDEVAEKAGTIGYELLTSLGGRVRRIYL